MGLLQHGGDHHEDDQQHEHDVGHGNHVGRRHLGSGYRLVGHGRLLLGAAAQDEVVDELHGGVVHLDVEGFDFVGEVVVSPDGRDGHEETEGGGDERFGDTAGDGRETALHFGMNDGDGALQTALGGVNDVGVRNLL